MVAVDTAQASPMAQSLIFGWIAVYMYEGDAPLAERRAAALALDRDLLRELLGAEELRDLLDADVLHALEDELQHLVDGRRARDLDEIHDLLRVLGPLTGPELVVRSVPELGAAGVEAALERLASERRAIVVSVAGEDRWAAAEDAGRLRDALGCTVPLGLPGAYTESVDEPLTGLVVRHARTHGPFLARDVAGRLGLSVDRVRPVLDGLTADGALVRGEFRPGGAEREWCDPEVLRQLRRRSLAVLRPEVEPVDGAALGRFLPHWQGVGLPRRGQDALVEVISVLAGASIPASVLEVDVLPARMADYQRADLDALCTAGAVVWVGAGPLGSDDGRLRLVFRDQVPLLVPDLAVDEAARRAGARGPARRPGQRAAPRSGTTSCGPPPRPAPTTTSPPCWPPCGTWSGRARSPTTRWPRCGPWCRAGRGRRRGHPGRPPARAGPAPPGAAHPHRAAHRRRSLVAGGLAAGTAARAGPAHPHRGGPRPGLPAARALRRLDPRGGPGGGTGGRLRRGVPGAQGARGARCGAAGLLRGRARRRPVRPARRGRSHPLGPGSARRTDALGGADGRGGRRCDDVVVLAATDPAQPYGAALPWPPTDGRPARSAGALVVLVDGEAAVFVERGGRSLLTFPAAVVDGRWPDALAGVVRSARRRSLEVAKIDAPPRGSRPTPTPSGPPASPTATRASSSAPADSAMMGAPPRTGAGATATNHQGDPP